MMQGRSEVRGRLEEDRDGTPLKDAPVVSAEQPRADYTFDLMGQSIRR